MKTANTFLFVEIFKFVEKLWFLNVARIFEHSNLGGGTLKAPNGKGLGT